LIFPSVLSSNTRKFDHFSVPTPAFEDEDDDEDENEALEQQ
jgi:hypothetical protein